MNSHRETNSELNYSEEKIQDLAPKEHLYELHDLDESPKRIRKHRLSERKLPLFLQKTRASMSTNIQSEIEETKNKIIKNLESIKKFNIDIKYNNHKYHHEYDEYDDFNGKDKFNIYKYIDERKNIREKILLYNSHLDSDVLRLIEYLSLEPIKRTKSEHKFIKQYLMKTTLMQSLLNLNENKRNITKIINRVCLNLKYKFLFAGKTIYEINDTQDNYYYLIEGKVQAFKPEKIIMRMTGFEYFTYIMRLKRDNEKYLIDLILKNQTNYIIYKNHLPILNYIFFIIIFKEYCSNINYRFYFKYELEDKKYNYDSPLDKMINLCFCEKEELLKNINLKLGLIEHKSPMKELEKQIKKNIPQISEDVLKYYTPMALDKKLFDITLFKYKTIVTLKKGSFFGESTNKKHSLREFTLKTVEDCHLSYIEIEIYDSFLKNEKEKITAHMIDYLYNKFFFCQISESEFKNQFFESFLFEVKEFGQKLVEQNKKLDYIYFIKEGEVSINSNLSINSFINNIIKPLQENYIMKYNETFLKLIGNLEIFLKNNKMNNKEINSTPLFIDISRSIIGLDSYFYGFSTYIYDAVVTSSKVKYFKIEKKYLLRIFREYYFIKEIAQNEALQKILLIIDRFTQSLKMKIKIDNNSIIYNKNNNKNNKISNFITVEINNEGNENGSHIHNVIKYNYEKEKNNNYDYYEENSSINNSKRLNKCYIINCKNNEDKGNISELLLNQKRKKIKKKTMKEKKYFSVNQKLIKNLEIFSDFSNVNKYKSKLKKISIQNETLLVNLLQKNIEKNLLFSKSIKKPKISSDNSLNDKSLNDNSLNDKSMNDKSSKSLNDKSNKSLNDKSNKSINDKSNKSINITTQTKIKRKLKPLINTQNYCIPKTIKNLKYDFNTQQIVINNNNKEKDNSNSLIKTFRSIKTNTIDLDNKNYYEFNDIEEEDDIIQINNITKSRNSLIDDSNYFSKNSLYSINKNIFKKQNSNTIIENKLFPLDNKYVINKFNRNLLKSFSTINNMSNKKFHNILIDRNIHKKNKLNNLFLLQKAKKAKYIILKKKILQENYWK